MPEDTTPPPAAPDATPPPVGDTPVATPPDAGTTPPPAETPPPPPKHYHQDIWDDATPGKLKVKWQESLPAEFDDRKGLLGEFDSFDSITKALKDNMTAARAKGWVKPLDEKSTPEDIASYRKHMGIPDAPYELPKPEQLPEGVVWQDERMKEFGAWARENNLLPKQVEKIAAKHMEYLAQDFAAHRKAEAERMAQNLADEKRVLQLTFGGTLGTVVQKAARVAIMPEYGIPPEAVDPNSPRFLGVTLLKVLSDLADAKGESRIPSAAAVVNFHHDPIREMTAIQTDPSHPMHADFRAGGQKAMAKVDELRREAEEARKRRAS